MFGPPPPPINFVHGTYMQNMDAIDLVAAALGSLAFSNPSARPVSLTLPHSAQKLSNWVRPSILVLAW